MTQLTQVTHRTIVAAFVALAAIAGVGCGSDGGGTNNRFASEGSLPIAPRTVTIVAETCSLSSLQLSSLQQPALRKVARELILICPAVRLSGEVAPTDPDARAAFARTVAQARTLGYKTRVAVTMGDDLSSFPVPYSPARAAPVLRDPAWRAKVVTALAPFAEMGDGLEMDLLALPDSSRPDVTALFIALDLAFRPRVPIGVMAPPSSSDPSDTPGGAAFDLAAVAPRVDRVRMMTLDFSCCGQAPGPSIDSGWAVDVARYGKSKAGNVPVDIAFPLYGTDFSDLGESFVDYTDGRAIADVFGITPQRAVGGELNFDWTDAAGRNHQTWYPDALTASRVLHAWDSSVLPLDVGVVLYGLGSEDPALWTILAGGLP
jgi:hypothetical protein